ncbi:MAG: HD domain-containing protein [SAR324 cluster bacterium]|nr:HD domain-containing protein [SAR324 cluster bacterium]
MNGGATREGRTTELLRAISFAAEKHRDHRRKGAIAAPYINHPITVAQQLAEAGCEHDTDLLMAAVLHDVIEDTDSTEEELQALFGTRVAGIVMEVTDDKALRSSERKALVVKHIAGKSREARLLKLSDLIANVYDVIHHPPNWQPERKRNYFDWGERVVNAMRGIHPALERRFAELLDEARRGLGD